MTTFPSSSCRHRSVQLRPGIRKIWSAAPMTRPLIKSPLEQVTKPHSPCSFIRKQPRLPRLCCSHSAHTKQARHTKSVDRKLNICCSTSSGNCRLCVVAAGCITTSAAPVRMHISTRTYQGCEMRITLEAFFGHEKPAAQLFLHGSHL